MNLYKCKVCGEEKPRITNKYGVGGTKRWVDNFGAAWNGKTCPDCFRAKMKMRYTPKPVNKAEL